MQIHVWKYMIVQVKKNNDCRHMTLYAILYYGKQDRPQFYLKAQWAVSIHKYCNIIVKSKAFNVIISEF